MPTQKSGKEHPHTKRDDGPSPEQKGYSTSEAIISLRDELLHEVAANRDQPETPKKSNWIDTATLVLVIVTTTLLVIQDIILHSSDDTFKATLKHQIESSEQQLRAYVGFTPGDIEDFGIQGKWRVKFGRKNFGQTPAYDVGFSQVGFAIVSPGEQIAAGAGGCANPKIKGLFTLFPTADLPLTEKIGDKNSISKPNIFDPKLIEMVKAGDRQFVYWGNVCYNDAFGHSHYTNYCWAYSGSGMTAKDAEGCLTHNDSN